ncbi:MAG: glycosyltransferase family 4 protein [Patescibacteria group bacterium]|nr:glycosyltransferase family 4 protein [Patescibacteria group bacterium]
MNKSLSILMVIERFAPIVGGAETQCRELSEEFTRQKAKVTVVTKRWQKKLLASEVFPPGFVVKRLGTGFGRLADYWSGLSLAFYLLGNFKKFDIFYINGGLANIFGSTATMMGKIFGKKVVSKVETPGELFFSGDKALSAKKYVHLLIKTRLALALKADFFVAQTPEIKEELISLRIKEARIKSFTNSVDDSIFFPINPKQKAVFRKKYPFPQYKFWMTFCGRLVRRKGLLVLLDAWKMAGVEKKAILIIVGSGEGQPDSVEREVKEKVKQEKIANVYFLGTKGREEVAKLLQASDIFVYPSIHPEGTALSVLEAMACSYPVVVSDLGGLKDVVSDGVEGLLVPAGQVEPLAFALNKLIKNTEQGKLMGKNGLLKIKENYLVEKNVSRYLAFFNEVV